MALLAFALRRAQVSQAGRRGFESHRPLSKPRHEKYRAGALLLVRVRRASGRGKIDDCTTDCTTRGSRRTLQAAGKASFLPPLPLSPPTRGPRAAVCLLTDHGVRCQRNEKSIDSPRVLLASRP